jgi:WD40 repeat protein
MAEGAHPSRDLRLGLLALESGLIDQEQLITAVRAWARSGGRSLGEVLTGRGWLDADTRRSLEGRVTEDLSRRPDPVAAPPPESGATPTTTDQAATIAYVPPAASTGRGKRGSTRFQIIRPHARGGLGEVFLALDRELNRTVALKELPSERAHDGASQDRFVQEAEVTGRLEHPGIVPVYGFGRYDDGRPFYAMRFIEGETLRDAIDRFHRGGAGIRPGDRELAFHRLLRSVTDAGYAVAYAHSRGVVHRDLKPENVMLGRFGETLVVDWGVAKAVAGPEELADSPGSGEDAAMTRPGSVVGTPRYMSPEQAAGDLDRVGPASDVYGLGAILYGVLTGRAPFTDGSVRELLDRVRRGIFPSPRRLVRTVDPTLEAICLKAMALEPSQRHATALDLAHDVESWLADVRYRGEQQVALGRVKDARSRLCLERARMAFGQERREEGLLWMVRALEEAPDDLTRAIRTGLGAWLAGPKMLERSLPLGGEVRALGFSPEARRLATTFANRAARLWDLATGTPLSAPLEHGGPVLAVAFSPDGDLLASASDDGTVRFWNTLDARAARPPIDVGGPVMALAFSPDGSRLAAACDAEAPFLWEWPDARPLAVGRARVVVFSPDGGQLAIATGDGDVVLHDGQTGRRLAGPFRHGTDVLGLSFGPDGRRLLTTGADAQARLWDVGQGAAVVTLSHRGPITCGAFRPDGGVFATARGDGAARLWDAANGRPIGEELTHRPRVDRLAFSPAGDLLATAGADGQARLWCASTGLPIGPALSHGAPVRELAFSPDGRRLITGGADGLARCWKVPGPVEGNVEQLACWARVETGLDFDEGDAVVPLDGGTSWDLRRRLVELGGSPFR